MDAQLTESSGHERLPIRNRYRSLDPLCGRQLGRRTLSWISSPAPAPPVMPSSTSTVRTAAGASSFLSRWVTTSTPYCCRASRRSPSPRNWKNGKPKRLASPEEAARSPRIVKVVRLESYQDALNNLETRRTDKQQLLLDSPEAQRADGLKEEYILRYMLDVETRGSRSLLNVQAITDPTAYKLKVKRPGSDESREVNVDLAETFNWLIGLTVRHIAAPRAFSAGFERDGEKRLRLNGRLKQEEHGRYWFRTVAGTTPDGRRTLVIWRKLTGEPEQDNLVLDEWFTKQGYSARDSEFDLIYVNGGNNLENLKTPDDLWKVRLIEEDFHRLMFDTEGNVIAKRKARTSRKRPQVPFAYKLVLNQWILSLFNVNRFEELAEHLRNEPSGRAGREQHPPLPPCAYGRTLPT